MEQNREEYSEWRPYIVCVCLVFLISLLVCGCGKQSGGKEGVKGGVRSQTESAAQANRTVYHREIPVETTGLRPLKEAREIFSAGDRLYICGYRDLGDEQSVAYVENVGLADDGALKDDARTIEFQDDDPDAGYYSFAADEGGNVYALRYAPRKGVSNPRAESDYETTIVKASPDGARVWESAADAGEGETLYNVYGLYAADGAGLIAQTTDGIYLFDMKTGERTRRLFGGANTYYAPVQTSDGALWLFDGDTLTRADADSGAQLQKIDLGDYYWDVYAGNAHDFYLTDYDGVYTYDIGDKRPAPLIDCMASDLTATIDGLVPLADGALLALLSEERYYETTSIAVSDLSASASRISVLRADPNFNEDKIILTLGAVSLGTDMRYAVADFNRTNETYRVQTVDFFDADDQQKVDAFERMGQALLSGNAPDMMMFDGREDMSPYFEKEIFEPLDPYFENDEGIDKEDLFANVLDASRYQDKLYALSGSFYVNTVFAKQAVADTTKAWTFDDLLALCERYNLKETALFGEGMDGRTGTLYALLNANPDLVDFDTGECAFDGETFQKILAFCKAFPSWEDLDTIPERETTDDWSKGSALLLRGGVSIPDDYMYIACGVFDAPVCAIGYPADDGRGRTYVNLQSGVAMSANSAHKDGCWEFMRSVLSDTYQQNLSYAFPLRKSEAKKQIDALIGAQPDENAFWFETNAHVRAFTKEDADDLMALLLSADETTTFSQPLFNIVTEEAAAYFEGQKDAAEVARIIQSRAQTYLQEKR